MVDSSCEEGSQFGAQPGGTERHVVQIGDNRLFGTPQENQHPSVERFRRVTVTILATLAMGCAPPYANG
jgi:hypothetical protein